MPEVLIRAAATFDLDGSHLLHSILPSLFLLSPLTDMPLTAFLVHRDLPCFFTPQPSLVYLEARKSPPSWSGEFVSYYIDFLVNLVHLLLAPRISLEVVNSDSNTRFAC